MNKYDSGQYYKICLYSGSDDWVDGSLPGGKGALLVAIAINTAIGQIDVAIDKSVETSAMTLIIDDKINMGLSKLGIDPKEKLRYKIFYQSANGTQLIPSFKRIHKKSSILKKIANIFTRK